MRLRTALHRACPASLLVIMGLLLGACTSSRRGASAPLDVRASPGGVLLAIRNQHAQDIRVVLVRGPLRVSLATLTTGETRTVQVRSGYLGGQGGFRLTANPVGSREVYTTDWIPAAPGDHVDWTVAHRLHFSRFSVRPAQRR